MIYFWTLFIFLVRTQVLATHPWDFVTVSKFSLFNVFCTQHQTDIWQSNTNKVPLQPQDPQWPPTASPYSSHSLTQCGRTFTIQP